MHVTAVLDAIKKRGHFQASAMAQKAYVEQQEAVKLARAGLALLDGTSSKGSGKMGKKSRKAQEAKSKAKEAEAKAKEAEVKAKEAEGQPKEAGEGYLPS